MMDDDEYDNTPDPAEHELQFTLEQGSDPYPAMRPRGINRRHLILGAAVGIMVMFLVIIVIGTAVSTYFIFNHPTKTHKIDPNWDFTEFMNDIEESAEVEDWIHDDGIDATHTVIEPPPLEAQPIRNTSEYQIALQHLDRWNSVEARNAFLDQLFAIIKETTGLGFSKYNGNPSVRVQYKLNTENCTGNGTFSIRIRDYSDGPNKGLTTVDIKGNEGHRFMEAYEDPYWPGPFFYDNDTTWQPTNSPSAISSQKLEQDVHSDGGTKFSRESRIFLHKHPKWDKWHCGDLLHLFPWAFVAMNESTYNSPILLSHNVNVSQTVDGKNITTVTLKPPEPWWVYEHNSYLMNIPGSSATTKHPGIVAGPVNNLSELPASASMVESTVTLQYDSVISAQTSFPPPKYGEWSLRVYGTNSGLGPWDQDVINVLENMYAALKKWNGD